MLQGGLSQLPPTVALLMANLEGIVFRQQNFIKLLPAYVTPVTDCVWNP